MTNAKIAYEKDPHRYDGRSRSIPKGLPYVNNHRGKLIHAVRRAAVHTLLGRQHMSVHTRCGAGFSGAPDVLMLTGDPNETDKFFCKRCYEVLEGGVSAKVGRLKVQEVQYD